VTERHLGTAFPALDFGMNHLQGNSTIVEIHIMSIFEKTRHCTKRFPCRFKLALMVFSMAVVVSIAAVPLMTHLAW
jgi:hypothetical protein